MHVVRGRSGKPSENRSATFTGTVWGDSVISTETVTVNNVFFAPEARTYWHRHEEGQLLIITHGMGYVANQKGDVYTVKTGDQVFIPGGEVHWHGGSENSYLLHTAVSIKKTEWLHEVSDTEYNLASKRNSDKI